MQPTCLGRNRPKDVAVPVVQALKIELFLGNFIILRH